MRVREAAAAALEMLTSDDRGGGLAAGRMQSVSSDAYGSGNIGGGSSGGSAGGVGGSGGGGGYSGGGYAVTGASGMQGIGSEPWDPNAAAKKKPSMGSQALAAASKVPSSKARSVECTQHARCCFLLFF